MPAIGPKETWRFAPYMSLFADKADMTIRDANIGFAMLYRQTSIIEKRTAYLTP
jgi:hypothetical protein